MLNKVVEMRGEKHLGSESWIIASDTLTLESWRKVIQAAYATVSHYFRSQMSILVFPITEKPSSGGMVFRNVYLIPPWEMPSSLGDVALINQLFLEKFFPKDMSVVERCSALMSVWDIEHLKKKWIDQKTVFVGIYASYEEESNDQTNLEPPEIDPNIQGAGAVGSGGDNPVFASNDLELREQTDPSVDGAD